MAKLSFNSISLLLSLSLASFILTSHNLFSISTAFEAEMMKQLSATYDESSGNGPSRWGQLNPEWRICNNGTMQSPIDIPVSRVPPRMGNLTIDYKPAPATLQNRGHDIAVYWNGDAGGININGIDFKLQQCHWHSPTEHVFDGIRHQLELHAVHMSSNGTIAVIGILYKYGSPDPFLAKLMADIKSLGKEDKDVGIVNPEDIKFGSIEFYYRYMGSLTAPPCTEGVVWTVLSKVRTVSREQVQALRDAVHDGFEYNARPIQPRNRRNILFLTSKAG
ncbi:alpha carbonic anhydrase 4-like isoform X1 [Diospyros lotus]|uniref:alpha carbonic anhydrase 4-like isoform X1 n=2 Tax=Diospyros lotus TaxID=55363 RepID=UPI0022584F6E|nr:alpha carbonic anhydrase 4-like isoform X1 [Diospyros lotus]